MLRVLRRKTNSIDAANESRPGPKISIAGICEPSISKGFCNSNRLTMNLAKSVYIIFWMQKFRQRHRLSQETTLYKFEMAKPIDQINKLLTSCDDHYPEDGKDRQDGGTGFLSGYGAHVIHVNKDTAHRNGKNGNNEGQNILPIAHSIKDTGDQDHDRCDYQTHQRTGQCFQGSLGGLFQGISNRHQGKDANRPRCKIL